MQSKDLFFSDQFKGGKVKQKQNPAIGLFQYKGFGASGLTIKSKTIAICTSWFNAQVIFYGNDRICIQVEGTVLLI